MEPARHQGRALVGVESVTPGGPQGRLQGLQFLRRGSGGRGCVCSRNTASTCSAPSSSACQRPAPETFDATAALAQRAGVTFAQFVMLTPFPGTVDFEKWERSIAPTGVTVAGVPLTRHWLIPQENRPKVYSPHPTMTPDEICSTPRACGIASTRSLDLGALARRQVLAGASRFYADLETLPADVYKHRHRDRLGAGGPLGQNGAADGASLSAPVLRSAHAGPAGARPGLTRLARRRRL